MASKCCSNVVESRVEHAILDAESRRNAALSSVRNSPGALVFGDARTSDDRSMWRAGPLYRRVERLVNRIIGGRNACGEFVRMVPVANQGLHADLGRGSDRSRFAWLILKPN